MGRVTKGPLILGVSALVLIGSIFLTWISLDLPDVPDLPEGVPVPEGVSVPDVDDTVDLWQGSTLDIYLAITGAIALLPVVLSLGGRGAETLPFPATAVAFVLGVMGVILVAAFLTVDFPDGADRGIGAFVGLAGTLGVSVGSFLTLQEETLALDEP
jgi:hypothetical protein